MDGFQPNSMIKVAVVVLFHWMFVAGLLGGWREDMEKQSGFNVHLKLEQKSMISSLDFYQIRHSRMILFPFPSPPWSNGIDVLLFWIRENETWQIKCAHCTSPKKGRLITYVTVVYIYFRLCRHYGIHALCWDSHCMIYGRKLRLFWSWRRSFTGPTKSCHLVCTSMEDSNATICAYCSPIYRQTRFNHQYINWFEWKHCRRK